MKAAELMIGDWVMDGDMPTRVTSITCDGIVETERRISNIEVVEPIPLTPEILKKNGFGYTEIDPYSNVTHYYPGEPQYCADMDLHIGGIYKGIFWLNTYKNVISNIRFVHELQHAFRICKIDKEIEL